MQRKHSNRKHTGIHLLGFAALAAVVFAPAVHAGLAEVQEFDDKDQWIAAIGGEDAFTTIDFTGFSKFTFIEDQYAELGVQFTDGPNVINHVPGGFLEDEWGINGNFGTGIDFDTPQRWIGVDFPGAVRIELYSNDELVFEMSPGDVFGGGGLGFFGGLISDTPFDRAFLYDPFDIVFIDDIHFGVPAPPALALFALWPLATFKRRRY